MNGIFNFAENWGHWMLHAGWQAAVVALVVLVILRIGQNRISSQLRYALLLVVLLKFATPPFLSLPIGIFSQPSVAQMADVTPAPTLFRTVQVATPDPLNLKSQIASELPVEAQPATSGSVESGAQAEVVTGTKPSQPVEFSTYSLVMCFLFLAYVAGVVLYLTRLFSQYRTIQRQVLASQSSTQYQTLDAGSIQAQHAGSIQARLHELSQRLRMKHCPQLRISNGLDAPFAIGAIDPVIVLPQETIDQLDSDQLDIVMAHELAHVRRRDMLIGWFETVLTALWWFHPAIWWLKSSLRQTREDCCDDMLIANQIAQPDRYCETIIQAAARQTTHSLEPIALGFTSNEHPAGRRIRRLMNTSIRRFDRLQFTAVLFSLLVAAIAIPGLQQREGRAPVVSTSLERWGGWRNLPFDIDPEEETAVRECVEISRRMTRTHNGIVEFTKTETRDDLNAILKQHPDYFYAKHLLGTWHRSNGDGQLAATLINESLQQAPIVLTRRYATGDGKPVAGLNVGGIEIECNRVQRGSLDPSLKLRYEALITDADGVVSLPIYDTVYRLTGWSYPKGYDAEGESLGWFESKAKTGVLPEVMLWKPGSKPRNFTRPIAEVPRLKKATGTDTLELQSGGNVYRLGRVARRQADNAFVSENGKGKPWTGSGLPLPTLTNGQFMDHAVIDLDSPLADRFEIRHVEVLDAQTSLPLDSFQNGAGFVRTNKHRIELFSIGDKLPDSVSLVLTVHNYKESDFRHEFSADPNDDVEVEQGDNVLSIDYLAAGNHIGWSSRDGFVGEAESIDTISEVIFRIEGQGRQKFSVWYVNKEGRRFDLKPYGWMSASVGSEGPITIGAPLNQIDHFELLPYRESETIYFENLRLPARQAELDQALPSAQFEIGGEARTATCLTFAPLEIKFQSYSGDVWSIGALVNGGYTLGVRKAEGVKTEKDSTVIWKTNALCEFDASYEFFDGMDWSSGKNSYRANTNFGVVATESHQLPLEQVQAARVSIRPKAE